MTEIEFFSTHLYPGARGRIVSGDGTGAAMLVFADDARASAHLAAGRLEVDSYLTTAQTLIPARAWEVTVSDGALRISRRA